MKKGLVTPFDNPPTAPFTNLQAVRDWHQQYAVSCERKAERHAVTAQTTGGSNSASHANHFSERAKMHQSAVNLIDEIISPAKLAA
jgi:hypothetical protein